MTDMEQAGREPAHAAHGGSHGSVPRAVRAWRRFKAMSLARKIIAVCVALVLMLTVGAAATAGTMYGLGAMRVHDGMARGAAKDTIVSNGKTYRLNRNIVTFMFLGFDGRNKNGMDGQTDVIMVAALDTRTNESTIITVPRDSMVESPYYVGNVKLQDRMSMPLCLSYAFAGGGERGRDVVADTVSGILGGVAIPYHYMLDYNGLPDLNDAIGGVTLTPIQSIPETSIEQGKPITLKGWESERYVRWRDHETLQSPLDRQQRQMHYAKAFLAQAKRRLGSNVFSAVGIMNAMKQWTFTNTGTPELMYYASLALRSHNLADLPVTQLPGELVRSGNHARFILDRDGVKDIVLKTFYTPE